LKTKLLIYIDGINHTVEQNQQQSPENFPQYLASNALPSDKHQIQELILLSGQVIDLYRVVDLATPAFRAGSADKIRCKTSY
jgi:hypothetical protein